MILSENVSETARDAQWWLADEGKVHERLFNVVHRLRAQQQDRFEEALHHARLWGDRDIVGLTGSQFNRFGRAARTASATQNVTRNMIKAAVSRITQNRPKLKFLPNGRDYAMHRKTKKLEKAVAGCFSLGKFYEKTPVIYRDALIFEMGVVCIYADHERRRVNYDRVFPFDLLVDEEEAVYGDPPSIYYLKSVDKHEAISKWAANDPELAAKIRNGTDSRDEAPSTTFRAENTRVLVVEAYHLPSGPKANDGMYAVCIDGADVEIKEWKRERHPFAPVYWTKPLMGYYGTGLAYELCPLQIQVNRAVRDIEQAHGLNGKGYWMIPAGSGILPGKISTVPGTAIRYTGIAPTFVAPTLISPEIYPWLDGRVRAAHETTGMSQIYAQGQKPSGLNSGEAQRVYADQQSLRFIDEGRTYEEWVLLCGELTIDACKELADVDDEDGKKKPFTLRYRDRNFLETIDWADVDLDRDCFDIDIFPASMLPTTPAGRVEFINDMRQFGMDPDDALELLDVPDVDTYISRRLSQRRDIDRVLEHNGTPGAEYIAPEPFDLHQYGIVAGLHAYHEAREYNAPDAVLRQLMNWVKDCWRWLNPGKPLPSLNEVQPAEAPPPATPEMGAPGMMPPPPGAMPPPAPMMGAPPPM